MIGADGKQLGVMSLREALDIAQKAGVDLVEISPKANPPVAIIPAVMILPSSRIIILISLAKSTAQ